MAAKGYTTGYIIGFAALVCLACSVAVSFSAVLLKDKQEVNKVIDRQKKVLVVAGLAGEDEVETLSNEEISKRFDDNITARVVNLETGEYNDDINPETFDQRKARQDPQRSEVAPPNKAKVIRLPYNALVYHVQNDRGEIEKIILPIEGYGLWSTLYGYIALEKDANTVAGITFYEHGETPGLGGEVDNPKWKSRWPGRKIFDAEGNVALHLVKGSAGPPEEHPYQVDGLSGASLTTNGVNNLIHFWLGPEGFGPYLDQYESHELAMSSDPEGM